MSALNNWYEPQVYRNRFGMNEYEEESFINSKIEEFCKAALHTKNQEIYELIYEYILDNLEKFVEVSYE